MKINVGSGSVYIEGWVNVDLHTDADIQASMISMPFESDSAEEIHCCHSLEHLSFEESSKALVEFYRILKNSGLLRIVIPNMDFIAGAWLHGSDRSYRKQILFGSQVHQGEFHKNAWNLKDIIYDIEEVGFKVLDSDIRWTPEYSQESIIVEATK